MKTLTVKQPWASLIVSGIKDIENRTWATKYRGPVLIHASAKYAIPARMSNLEFFGQERFDLIQKIELFGLLYYRAYHPMAIIGQVDIVDCVINHPSVWADRSPNHTVYTEKGLSSWYGVGDKSVVYNWVLANPVQFDEPILNVKGKLSLWEWEGKS